MRISELGGENELIRLIGRRYGVEPDSDLVLGIGDDAALIRSGDRLLIVTTDLLVENTHFRMDINDPYLLGWKSVAVNLSDVAAMGGVPSYTFVSIGLPDVDTSVVEAIYEGMRDCCAEYGSGIAGGDTVGSAAGIVINVTQLGWVEPERAARRSGAKPGDHIVVTNTLGDSRAGLELLLREGLQGARERSEFLVARHLKPSPRLAEARAAVETGKVNAMMDISDGLSMDLTRMCEASGVGARVQADQLPISDDLRAAARVLGTGPAQLAASGGEDYELLITCDDADAAAVTAAVEQAGSKASVVGEVVQGASVSLVTADRELPMPRAWQHF